MGKQAGMAGTADLLVQMNCNLIQESGRVLFLKLFKKKIVQKVYHICLWPCISPPTLHPIMPNGYFDGATLSFAVVELLNLLF